MLLCSTIHAFDLNALVLHNSYIYSECSCAPQFIRLIWTLLCSTTHTFDLNALVLHNSYVWSERSCAPQFIFPVVFSPHTIMRAFPVSFSHMIKKRISFDTMLPGHQHIHIIEKNTPFDTMLPGHQHMLYLRLRLRTPYGPRGGRHRCFVSRSLYFHYEDSARGCHSGEHEKAQCQCGGYLWQICMFSHSCGGAARGCDSGEHEKAQCQCWD